MDAIKFMRITDHQSEKPHKPIRQTFEGCNFEGDPRFRDYAQALKEGDLDTCSELQERYQDDREIITKFQTIERMWIAMMAHYVREIQISHRERDGYRALADGLHKKLENIKTSPGPVPKFDAARACFSKLKKPVLNMLTS